MLKKIMPIVTILLLAICCSASAAGKLSVTQENFFVYDQYGLYGYTFARVDNVGDKPITVNAGLVEIFDTNGDTLTSSDYLNMFAQVLQPDEYTYVASSNSIENASSSDVDDYLLTVTGKSEAEYLVTRFPTTTDYRENVEENYSTANYMYATITNDTDEAVYDINVVMALLDDDGNILYIDSSAMYNTAIEPGSSVTVRCSIYDEYLAMLKKKGLSPTHVDAIAYTQKWNY